MRMNEARGPRVVRRHGPRRAVEHSERIEVHHPGKGRPVAVPEVDGADLTCKGPRVRDP